MPSPPYLPWPRALPSIPPSATWLLLVLLLPPLVVRGRYVPRETWADVEKRLVTAGTEDKDIADARSDWEDE